MQLDGCPQGLIWKYDHTELITDGIVHAARLGFALVGDGAYLVILSVSAKPTNGVDCDLRGRAGRDVGIFGSL